MSPRSLTIALLASAALNVFLIGAGAGMMLAHAGWQGAAPPVNALRSAAQRLDPNNRDAMLEMLQDLNQANGPVLLDARRERREVRRLMTTEPFDKAATLAALTRARADDVQVRTQVEAAMVDFAAKLSPDQRAKLSAWVQRPQARPPGGRGLFGRFAAKGR
jgi:uncharacterized membrane protein